MAVPSDPRRSISQQTDMFLFKLAEYRRGADTIVDLIDGVNGQVLTGLVLSNILNILVTVKKDAAIIYKSAVRGRLLSEYPVDYPDAATRNTKVALASTAANNLITECNDLLAVVAAVGQIINADSTNGLINSIIISPQSDALRAAAVSVQNEIEKPTLPPIR